MDQQNKTAVIIGAGPAGLTAAFELIKKTDIKPVILEMSDMVGGIARTVNYKGNRIDIGGHRFFSKSDRVMSWWNEILPIEKNSTDNKTISYQGKSREISNELTTAEHSNDDKVMLIRQRKSRIYFLRKFFDYPISLSVQTLKNLGLKRTIKIGFSYMRWAMFPYKDEKNLEQFFINRFGRELYLTFFKSYTEKVWGVPCDQIDASWGAQRIKGLSLTKAVLSIIKKPFSSKGDISQKKTETSLIEQFLYPKFGPGQLWEAAARIVESGGGQILFNKQVVGINYDGDKISSLVYQDVNDKATVEIKADYFFSTMPVKDLVNSFKQTIPDKVKEVANGLMYRDFITVGLLVKKMKIREGDLDNRVEDNWIYIQEPDVKIGRLQIFNNWSPYLVADPDTVWLGLEYFGNEGDELWLKSDEQFKNDAIDELVKIGIIDRADVLDSTLIRMPKTYPAYFGSYNNFNLVREYLDRFYNLFLIGRNGMHRYNNQDHSMLTAMIAVENIIGNVKDKENIWSINAEEDYHEEK